jgi:uncharacterized membrane protein YeaQ/YmgE (transglycosylase-associated protein family)
MSIIGWLVPGLIAGVVAGKLVNKAGGGLALEFVAVVGAAVVVLVLHHALVGHRTL